MSRLQNNKVVVLDETLERDTHPVPTITTVTRTPAFETGPLRFNFPINEPLLCAADENSNPLTPFLLIVVHSQQWNTPSRDSIRETWGRISRDYFREKQVRLLFIVGNVDRTEHKWTVLRESRSYRDVISADFVDTYRNLTLKSLAGIYWAQQFCPVAKYILKTDDDMYFNVSNLLRWLEKTNSNITRGIVGRVNQGAQVLRSGQWKVDERLYPSKTYPRYCDGCAYLLTSSMAARLFNASHRVPLLPIEDVYITGLLANAVGANCWNHDSFPHWLTDPAEENICDLVAGRSFGVHRVDFKLMYSIYRRSLAGKLC
ncbi:Beta-1,3-galactosyltransferase 1, partial [Lamellibrachia satsuma]